jgi:hypothetical protein
MYRYVEFCGASFFW